jgi:hypothetical protein
MNQFIEKIYAADATSGYTTLGQFFGDFNGADQSKDLNSVLSAIGKLSGLMYNIGLIVFGIMILYSSFLYVSSMGEEAKAETAKKTLIWSIVGFILIGLASMIKNVLDKELGL